MSIIFPYICITRIMHFLEKQWNRLITLFDQYYPIFKVWAFFMPVVFIRHPDDFKVMKYKKKFIFYN